MKNKLLWTAWFILLAFTIYGYSPQSVNTLMDLFKNDSKTYEFTVKDGYTENVTNLTGFVVKFIAKKSPTDTTNVIEKTCTISNPTSGIAEVSLSRSETNALTRHQYTAYVALTDALGDEYQTMLKSTLTVIQ